MGEMCIENHTNNGHGIERKEIECNLYLNTIAEKLMIRTKSCNSASQRIRNGVE